MVLDTVGTPGLDLFLESSAVFVLGRTMLHANASFGLGFSLVVGGHVVSAATVAVIMSLLDVAYIW